MSEQELKAIQEHLEHASRDWVDIVCDEYHGANVYHSERVLVDGKTEGMSLGWHQNQSHQYFVEVLLDGNPFRQDIEIARVKRERDLRDLLPLIEDVKALLVEVRK